MWTSTWKPESVCGTAGTLVAWRAQEPQARPRPTYVSDSRKIEVFPDPLHQLEPTLA